jgi:hypothetical protein
MQVRKQIPIGGEEETTAGLKSFRLLCWHGQREGEKNEDRRGTHKPLLLSLTVLLSIRLPTIYLNLDCTAARPIGGIPELNPALRRSGEVSPGDAT